MLVLLLTVNQMLVGLVEELNKTFFFLKRR